MAKTWTQLISEKTWSWIIILKPCHLNSRNTHAFIHACTNSHVNMQAHIHPCIKAHVCTFANIRTHRCKYTFAMQAHACILYWHIQYKHANTCTYTHKHCQYMHTSMRKPKHTHIDEIHMHTLTHLLYFSVTGRIYLWLIVFIKIVLMIFVYPALSLPLTENILCFYIFII